MARVAAEQSDIKTAFATNQLATLLSAFKDPEIPAFEGTAEEVKEQQYRYYKAHYFDNVDLADPRGLRSTYLDEKIGTYLDKLVVPSPDSLIVELDAILDAMRPAPAVFRAVRIQIPKSVRRI